MKKIKVLLAGLVGLLPVVAGAQTSSVTASLAFQIIIAYLPLLLILAIIVSVVLIISLISKTMQKGKLLITLAVLKWILIVGLALMVIGIILTLLGY